MFQFPVQALPPFEDDKGKYCIAFLYPKDFKGFLLEEDPEKKGKQGCDSLLINSQHQGIPVLLPEETLENISESNVTLTGIVSLLPENIIDSITNHICGTRENFYYGFFRPHSSRIAFCIDCRDRINSDINKVDKVSSLPAALYVEGHFEGVVDNKYEQEFRDAIPKSLPLTFQYADKPGKKHYLTEHESVLAMGADPSIFGFYTEANLADQRQFGRKLKELEHFYAQFRKNALNTVRKKYSIDVKLKPDFIFDYRRQNLFHPDGVLSSQDFDEVIKKHHELVEVAEWLKSAKE